MRNHLQTLILFFGSSLDKKNRHDLYNLYLFLICEFFLSSISKPIILNPLCENLKHNGNPTYPNPIIPTFADLLLIFFY